MRASFKAKFDGYINKELKTWNGVRLKRLITSPLATLANDEAWRIRGRDYNFKALKDIYDVFIWLFALWSRDYLYILVWIR